MAKAATSDTSIRTYRLAPVPTLISTLEGSRTLDLGDAFMAATGYAAEDVVGRSTRERAMDKDRVAGAAKQVKGSVKEATGKVTGDTKTEAQGAAEKAAGKGQSAVGGAKNTVRDAITR